MASVINQIKLGNVEYAIAASAYAECSTAAGTAAKVATINTDGDTTNTAFTLIKGVAVNVKFTVTNTAASPTLNINSTGAKAIYYNGAAITAGYLKANKIYQFVYNGTQWDLVGDVDTNTTYTFNGAVSTIKDNNLTANRALVSNSSGKVAVSDITSTELGYLDGVTSKIQTQLNNKTSTSVLPNNSGDIKTRFRISQKGNTNGATWYYKICDFPANDNSNYASAIVSGRIGGWLSNNMSYINALVWNRGTPGIALIDITGDATAMGNVWGVAELALYVNGTGATSANTATLYIKCTGYFTFDLDLEFFQSHGAITYDGTYITTAPTGTLVVRSSTTARRVELMNGKMLVNGTDLATTYATKTELTDAIATAITTALNTPV